MKTEKLWIWLEYFLVFSFLGWVYESIWCSVIEQNRGFVNRGFLTGPYLPIYGIGICLIFFVLKKFRITNGWMIFLTAVLIATIVELVGSFIMEGLTGSFAWDYTKDFGNFQGRIAVKPDMMFGFLTLLAYYGVLPLLERFHGVPKIWQKTVLILISFCFLADLAVHLLIYI